MPAIACIVALTLVASRRSPPPEPGPRLAAAQSETRAEQRRITALLRSLRREEPARAEALAGDLWRRGEATIEALLRVLEERSRRPSPEDRLDEPLTEGERAWIFAALARSGQDGSNG